MKIRRIAGLTAMVATGALALSACSSGGPSDGAATNANATGASAGVVSAWGGEPQNPLIPTNTNEVSGGKILDLIFAGLVYYDADGAPHNEVADSITSDDNVTWTIKLKDGKTFSDGTPVKAENFVKAWNFGATTYPDVPQQLSNYFFNIFEGYDKTTVCADEACEAFLAPESTELSGLKVVDDLTFTATLTSPQSDFPLRLGYSAYYPLPDSAFDDMEAFGENPVGNGPYVLTEWNHNVEAKLAPNDAYDGDRKAQNGGVDIKFYTELEPAYQDLLSGQLDVLDQVPDSAFGTFEADLGDRAVNQPAAIFQSFTIPGNLPHFGQDDEGRLRRQAISMAIDRKQITDVIFQGTRTPATDFTSPVIDGWSDSVPGNEVLKFDAAKAKDLWAQADAISPWEGTFTIAYNADGGHQSWVEAVTNSIKNTLGIDAEGKSYPDFATFRSDITGRTMTGAFRSGWQADYPSLYNFLGPLYGTGAGSNDGDYSNATVDQLLTEGLKADSVDDANALFQQVQEQLFKDLPAIPLWYSNATGGSGEAVDNVKFGWNSVPLLYAVTKQG
ncbi:ABC transporter substrate-binding protein [Xylanimonas allomyrinae]|uniref:ABC transporter substrate-binding protein n=1 Tax=Xylanimonas allomyrinae TaxID=2509459 RepID=A0A4V0YDV3_9MICO|nr:ABC transporter substrate-binding protein [Xylanimonas allomyrinae]QAY62011.1 ABC transporter substrate-binding protein [Xylanimonas allomyrinae]